MKKAFSCATLMCFLCTSIIGPRPVFAQSFMPTGSQFFLPVPGTRVDLSSSFHPPILKGLKVHPENPFRFDFIMDQGRYSKTKGTLGSFGKMPQDDKFLAQEAKRLIKYFLASLTVPEKDLWVNLSPYEKDRIIPASFGLTEMGRDLLAQDYMLKQITASIIYPENAVGKKFWKRVYEEASIKYGTTDIPVSTFNKVWIVPEKALVYENAKAGTAYVLESKLKVMLEEDYLSLMKHNGQMISAPTDVNELGSKIIREIVIPQLTREVNEGANFAQLRQVYNSLILAAWYKRKIKQSILAQVYEDKNKIKGTEYQKSVIVGANDVELIYQRYLQAFKKGAYNYIKEEINPVTRQSIPKKYFSGGFEGDEIGHVLASTSDIPSQAMIADGEPVVLIKARLDNAMASQIDWQAQAGRVLGHVAIDRLKVLMFAFQGDRNPLHTDINEALKSVFKGLVSHGILTTTFALNEVLKEYRDFDLDSIQEELFLKPVAFGEEITISVDGIPEVKDDKVIMAVKIEKKDKSGKLSLAGSIKLTLVPSKHELKPLTSVPDDRRKKLEGFADQVNARSPKVIFDFSRSGPSIVSRIRQLISLANIQSLQVLLGSDDPSKDRSNDAGFISQNIARKFMTRALAEIVPGHAIGGIYNTAFGALVQENDHLTAQITVKEGGVKEVYRGGSPMHRVNVEVVIHNQKNEIVLKSDVLMVMIMKDTMILDANDESAGRRMRGVLGNLMNLELDTQKEGNALNRWLSFRHALEILLKAEEDLKTQGEHVTLEVLVGRKITDLRRRHAQAFKEYHRLVKEDKLFIDALINGIPKYGLIDAMEALQEAKSRLPRPLPSAADGEGYWKLLKVELEKIEKEDRLAGGLRIIELLRSKQTDEGSIEKNVSGILAHLIRLNNAQLDKTLEEVIGFLKDEEIASQLQDPLGRILDILAKNGASLENTIIALRVLISDQAMSSKQATVMAVRAVKDQAMTPGGIDLSSDRALSVANNGQEIKLQLDPAMLKVLENAPGFVPTIIQILPLANLRQFLGI